jgi:hypothetical protein
VAAAIAALALLVAAQLGQAAGHPKPKTVALAKVALNADKLNGHKSSTSPGAGQIPVVGADGKLPASILPAASSSGSGGTGSQGAAGAAGPAGPAGPTGPTGPAGPAGPSNAYSVFNNGPIKVGFSGNTPVTVSIPSAGSYVVIAKGYVSTTTNNTETINCTLTAGGDNDTTQTMVDGTISKSAVALEVVHNYAAAGSATMLCNDTNTINQGQLLYLNWAKVTAIKVGSLTNNGA